MTTTNWHKLNFAVFSDVHTGHDHTPTELIIENLMREIRYQQQQQLLDIIFIPGDFFHQLLMVPSVEIKHIMSFISWLLYYCKKNDIKLRVLEGTPSHDWKQNYLFIQVNQMLEIGADVRYHDKLTIDYEEAYDLHILYIPDEWDEDNEVTKQQVKDALYEKGLQKVDIAMMHGMFAFQLPEHLRSRLPTHDQDYYESIVEYIIVIGHDHTHKANGKIVVPGSVDRTAHGEEGPKGYITVHLTKGKKGKFVFHENKGAMIYKSIQLDAVDMESSLSLIDEEIMKLPINSKVRLVFSSTHPIVTHLPELVVKYPSVSWSKPKITKIESESDSQIADTLDVNYTSIILTANNLEDKVLEHLSNTQPNVNLLQASTILKEVMRNV